VLDATFVVFVRNQDRILTGDWRNRMSAGVGDEVSVSVGSSEWLSGKGFSVSVAGQMFLPSGYLITARLVNNQAACKRLIATA
jgi:hypothetical protein